MCACKLESCNIPSFGVLGLIKINIILLRRVKFCVGVSERVSRAEGAWRQKRTICRISYTYFYTFVHMLTRDVELFICDMNYEKKKKSEMQPVLTKPGVISLIFHI